MHVKEILAHKGPAVVTIGPGAAVADVVASLAQHRIGALVATTARAISERLGFRPQNANAAGSIHIGGP